MENTQIILDLCKKDYSDEPICQENELVNRVQMRKFIELIENQIAESKEKKENDCGDGLMLNYHVHNTISIFGNRGAGKTTFLKTALNYVNTHFTKDVALLKTIDPSIIDGKQNSFITIIALIHECVQNYLYKTSLQIRVNNNTRTVDAYQDVYKKLLKGLPFVDGIGKENGYQDWDDDLYVSIQGMERAKESNNLVENFRKYIDCALHILDKHCFILPFDDIDTNANKGFEVLEIIRKYLVSDKVIIILTGDLDLYSKLVRKASWESFDLEFLKKECDYSSRRKEEFSHMVDHLESQYLLKILKPANRIHLKTIREIIESKESSIFVRIDGENDSISRCYQEIVKLIGFDNFNYRVISAHVHFFLGLSVRTQIRILKLYSDYRSLTGEEKLSESRKNQFIEDFVNIFWTDIKQKSQDAKSLVNDDSFYPVEMMKFLIDTQSLDTCSDFMPHTHDDIQNKALLAISAQFTKNVKWHSFIIFDYWLRISYIKYAIESFKREGGKNHVMDIINFSTILEHDDLTKCIGLVEAYCRSEYKIQQMPFKSFPGTIVVENTNEIDNSRYSTFVNIVSQGTINQSNESIRTISLYKLLAIIRDFLFHYIDPDTNEHLFISGYNAALLKKFSQYREYSEPEFARNVYYTEKKFRNSFVAEHDKLDVKWSELQSSVLDWKEKNSELIEKCTNISPQYLNRIFTRTYFSLINIDKDSSYVSLGQKFNAYILAFLNSVLVESFFDNSTSYSQVIARSLRTSIIIDNTDNIEYVFFHNYHSLNAEFRSGLFEWLFSCPLIRFFLDPNYLLCLTKEGKHVKLIKNIYERYYKRNTIQKKIESLEKKLKNYEELSKRLKNSMMWCKNVQHGSLHNVDKPIIFSLYPLSDETMYLDINMSANRIMAMSEKLSLIAEKVGLNRANISDEVSELKKEVDKYPLSHLASISDFDKKQSEFFDYLCTIMIK